MLKFTKNKKTFYILGISLSIIICLVVLLVIYREKPSTFEDLQDMVDSLFTNERKLTVLSDVYNVNRIYKSMKGPQSTKEIYLVKSEEPELLWITGYKAVMVGVRWKNPHVPGIYVP